MDNYNKELENKLNDMAKQKEESDRNLLKCEGVIGILSCIILLMPVIICSLVPMEEWQSMIITLLGLIPSIIGIFFAVKIEQTAGYYECKHCKHRYVPEYKAVIMAPHMGRTRYMKCPNCYEKSWQKKVLSRK